MPTPIIVDDLVDQVRDQLDEVNTVTVSDKDILQALDRGQDYAVNILVRQYPDPLVTFGETALVAGQRAYDMPEDIFEDRLQKVEIMESGIAWEVKRISYRDVSSYETNSKAVRPLYYYVLGNTYNLIPSPAGSSRNIRYWYIKELESMVKSQGRITTVNTSDNYVVVDSLGSDLTTSADNRDNYVNVVDAQTGNIKVSLQVSQIDTAQNRITFKATPDRSTVLNRTITGSIPSTIELDDYLCVSRGNAVPFLKKPMSNYVIQFAVAELKRKLGEPTEAEDRALSKFESEVEHLWAGRENTLRVKMRSRNWFSRFRRHFSD